MRLDPIEQPNSLLMRVAYMMCKRRVGKVITPLKVVYARVPGMLNLGLAVDKFLRKGHSLDREMVFLLQTHTARLNNCLFCVDIARAMALQGKLSVDKVNSLGNYADAPVFSNAEKAALHYIEETTIERKVTDETFANMKKYYTDKQIAEITVVNAVENFYNMINIPLEIEADGLCALVPGYHTKESARAAS